MSKKNRRHRLQDQAQANLVINDWITRHTGMTPQDRFTQHLAISDWGMRDAFYRSIVRSDLDPRSGNANQVAKEL